MSDRRRQIGAVTIASLVLLRLVIGWHFYREGSAKLDYNKSTGRFEVAFSAASFLSQAKGPLAGWFQSFAPAGHNYELLLAVAREDVPLTDAQLAERAKWQADYEKRRADAIAAGKPADVELPPSAPYHAWATRIYSDWKLVLERVADLPDLTAEQKRAAAVAYVARQQQLVDYLAGETEAITDYQHELWRLENMRTAPGTVDVPFQKQRLAAKSAEVGREQVQWVAQVVQFERDFLGDLRGVATPDQLEDSTTAEALDLALQSQPERRLRTINVAVAALTTGVGVCLLLGLFTRPGGRAGSRVPAGSARHAAAMGSRRSSRRITRPSNLPGY